LSKEHELGTKDIRTLLIKYSTPAIIAMLFNSLYNLVDTIFVGRGGGTMAIAGLAVSFPIQMLMMAIAQVIGIGAGSLISRSLGAGDEAKAEETAGTAFVTVVALSIVFTAFGLAFLNPILRLFGSTETILPYAREYMTVILAGGFFFAFSVVGNSLARAEGAARTAMTSMIIGAGMNIVLDPIFIFTFGRGIRGAAEATVLAQLLSCIYLVHHFRHYSTLQIKRSQLRFNWRLLPEVFSIGASSFARTVAGSLFSIVVYRSLGVYGTELHIAIYGVAHRVTMFLLMPLIGIVQGLQPIIGFNYGATRLDRVKEALKLGMVAASAMATFGFIVVMLFTEPLVRLFNNDPQLVLHGVPVVRIICLVLPVVGVQVIGSGFFQAIGKALPAFILSTSRQILFLIPLILILPLHFGLNGVFYAFPASDLLSVAITSTWVLVEIRSLNRSLAEPSPSTIS
jgi:putative MATE family efflux protein